ncbi:myrosinase 1-like [Schistocerca cancellata]|uniref:myrosinase 1-like n=1 Tax=Schistocerca cancellata TaxID=274614 RepID=UPI002119B0F5|nr:myrosinase 1-like [Schistocerca cancellata]
MAPHLQVKVKRGESIWDHILHAQPNLTKDSGNGDVAADSYHKHKEDVKLLVGLNANCYRFSLSWPRILPTGDTDVINQAGIDYYNNVINELLANGIDPTASTSPATSYKPQTAVVKMWLTFNEPNMFSRGYSGASSAPGANSSGIADYLMAKTILEAHAHAYRLYGLSFRLKQRGKVGITLDGAWYEPLTNSKEDADASERQLQFEVGLWANPIFSSLGNFPEVVRQRVAANSTADFFGLNHYFSSFITSGSSGQEPSKLHDAGVATSIILGYPISYWITDVPWGLRKLLNWVHDSYPGYPIFVTENG